jgi:hypothetical protein
MTQHKALDDRMVIVETGINASIPYLLFQIFRAGANSIQSLVFTAARNSARRSYHAIWSVSVKWALAGLGFGTT